MGIRYRLDQARRRAWLRGFDIQRQAHSSASISMSTPWRSR